MDEQIPNAAAKSQPSTAGQGRATAPTAVTPDISDTARPSGSAVYRSVYATAEGGYAAPTDVYAAPAAAPPASATPRTPYPRSAAEAVWADFAAPASNDAEVNAPVPAWTPPAVRGRVTVPGQVTATGPEPTSPPPPPFPPEPPTPPHPPMPSPEPFDPTPPPGPTPEPTPQPQPPAPEPPQPPAPEPPQPTPPPFPQPPEPPQPPGPPQPPTPPFPPPPPTAEANGEDLDRPMPVITAVPVSPVMPSIPRQVTPASGGGYTQDNWRSHFSSAPSTSAPASRGTVYGSRSTSEDAPGSAETPVPAS